MLDIINERVTEFPHTLLRNDLEKGSGSSVGKCKPTFISECQALSPLVNSQLLAATKGH